MRRKTNLPTLHREAPDNPIADGYYLAVAYRRPANRRDLDLSWALGFCFFKSSATRQDELLAAARRALGRRPGIGGRDFIARFCRLTVRDLGMAPIPSKQTENSEP